MDPPLRFGEFRLDTARGQLLRGDDVVPLAPKAFALLQYMAGHPQRLIPKRELLAKLWPGVYVGDDVLKTTVRDLRRALHDDAHTPRFIETAHRRGYRFVAVPAAPEAPRDLPPVKYARSGDVNIAYQVVGSGDRDMCSSWGGCRTWNTSGTSPRWRDFFSAWPAARA